MDDVMAGAVVDVFDRKFKGIRNQILLIECLHGNRNRVHIVIRRCTAKHTGARVEG